MTVETLLTVDTIHHCILALFIGFFGAKLWRVHAALRELAEAVKQKP